MFAKIISRRDGIPRSADGPRRDVRSIVRLERLDGVEIRGGRFRHGSVESPSVRAAVATDILLLRACRPRRDGRLPFRRPVAEIRRRLRVRPRTSRGDGRDVTPRPASPKISSSSSASTTRGRSASASSAARAAAAAAAAARSARRLAFLSSPPVASRAARTRQSRAQPFQNRGVLPGEDAIGTRVGSSRFGIRRGSHRRRGYVGRGCAREVERERDAPGGESLVRSNFCEGDVVERGGGERGVGDGATEGSLRRRRVERVGTRPGTRVSPARPRSRALRGFARRRRLSPSRPSPLGLCGGGRSRGL